MKSILAILLAAFVLQGCRGKATDSDDPGTSAGNDTITTMDAYGEPKYDNYTQTPGSGNVGIDSANNDAGGFDPKQGGNTGSNTGQRGGANTGSDNYGTMDSAKGVNP